MLEFLRKITLPLFVVVASSIFVAACSSSDNDAQPTIDAPDNGGDEVGGGDEGGDEVGEGDAGGGGEVIIEGPAPTTPLINSTSARSVAIEALELADALVFNFSDITALILAAETSGDLCAAGGSVSEGSSDNSRTFEFAACKLFADESVLVTGLLTLAGSFDDGFIGEQAFNGFSAVTGSRTVSIEGTADVQSSSGDTSVSNAQLVVNDSQADAMVTNSTFSISNRATASQSVTLDLILDMPRFGLVDLVISSAGLIGDNIACPQSGSLIVDAGDNGSLSVDGSEGENQTYTVDGITDTLACTEIASIFDDSAGSPFIPPPVPE